MTADLEIREVRMLALPVPLWAQSQQQHDELCREFALAITATDASHELPARLLTLVESLTEQYAGVSTEQEQQMFAASAAGQDRIDELVFQIPAMARDACIELGEMLDEADDYCRSGEHLLTLASSEETVAFRRWYLSEFVRQIDGEPPVAWPDYDGYWPGR